MIRRAAGRRPREWEARREGVVERHLIGKGGGTFWRRHGSRVRGGGGTHGAPARSASPSRPGSSRTVAFSIRFAGGIPVRRSLGYPGRLLPVAAAVRGGLPVAFRHSRGADRGAEAHPRHRGAHGPSQSRFEGLPGGTGHHGRHQGGHPAPAHGSAGNLLLQAAGQVQGRTHQCAGPVAEVPPDLRLSPGGPHRVHHLVAS